RGEKRGEWKFDWDAFAAASGIDLPLERDLTDRQARALCSFCEVSVEERVAPEKIRHVLRRLDERLWPQSDYVLMLLMQVHPERAADYDKRRWAGTKRQLQDDPSFWRVRALGWQKLERREKLADTLSKLGTGIQGRATPGVLLEAAARLAEVGRHD